MYSVRLGSLFLAGIAFLLTFFTFLYVPQLGLKSVAFVGLCGVAFALIWLPIRVGIVALFFYLGIEGFLKIVSSYNPLIHIGPDILVILLCLKVVVDTFQSGQSLPARLPPFFPLFIMHFVWVLICLFNPYSLGWYPSLAGAKVYSTMVLLFFFGFYQTKSVKDVQLFIVPFIVMTFVHTVFGLYQGYYGPASVLSLHPLYAAQLAKYADYAFRPFGLTNLPGGPAVFLALTFPLITYMFIATRSNLIRVFIALYIPAGVLLFLMCQIRASIVKMFIGVTIFLVGGVLLSLRFSQGRQQFKFVAIGFLVTSLAVVYVLPSYMSSFTSANESNEDAFDRSLTVFELSSFQTARKGTSLRFQKYLTTVPFGAGFARVGAASGKFVAEKNRDPYFAPDFFFADNFWLASLIEIGIPGMLLMTLILICILRKGLLGALRQQNFDSRLVAFALLGSLFAISVGLWGAESILYNPDSAFFWFFSGVLLKVIEFEGSNEKGLLAKPVELET